MFPIAQGMLCALTGISLYLIHRNGGVRGKYALFGVRLAINLAWPFFFYARGTYRRLCAALAMTISFYGKHPPYILWGDIRRGAESSGCAAANR